MTDQSFGVVLLFGFFFRLQRNDALPSSAHPMGLGMKNSIADFNGQCQFCLLKDVPNPLIFLRWIIIEGNIGSYISEY